MTDTTREAVERRAEYLETPGRQPSYEGKCDVAKVMRALLSAKEAAEAENAALRYEADPVSVGEAAKVLLVAQSHHAKNPYPQNMGPLNQLPATALRALADKGEEG